MVVQVQSFMQRALGRAPVLPAGLAEPPELSGGLPVVGHTVEFVRSAIDLLTRAQRELGEIAAIRVAGRRMVAVFGPEAHEAVFRAPDRVMNPQEAYKIMTPVFGEGMVYDAPTDKMNEQLKMLLPALKDRRMRTYGETIVAEVEASIASWGDEGELDLVDYCRVLTNFTSSACLLGHEFRQGMTGEFAEVYHCLERGITPVAYINANLPLPSFIKRDRARVRLVEMIGEIVAQRRRTGERGEDFLQTMMDATYQSGTPLSDHEITGMLLAAMFAGHHTSSVTTAWTIIELLQNRAYLDDVLAELDGTFGEDGEVSFETLRSIPLTEYAVKESLRLHPPLFMLVRVAKEDWSYKGYHIPAGTWMLLSPTVAQRMREVFADPMRFDPLRFAPPREEDKRDYAYIPFGGGRHKCMGNAFALLQVKAILAILLRRFEFELVDRNIGEDFHGLVIGPTQPCRIRYRRRTTGAPRAPKVAAPAQANGCPFHDDGLAEMGGAEAQKAASEFVTKRYEVVVDLDLCQGHAVCVGEAPEIFAVENDKVKVLDAFPPAALRDKAEAAAAYCPTHTIRIVEA
jgi:sterol 14alpha-demethylase